MIKGGLFLVLLILSTNILLAQDINIIRTNSKPKIDGVIEKEIWNLADSAYDFMQYFPFDTSLAEAQTVAKVLYDDEFIYVLGVMYNLPGERKYVTPSLRRDFRGSANDGFTVIFDSFNDRTNAFMFGINPFGVRREGLISNGEDLSLDWDNKWFGQAKKYDGYWIAEMAIPFKTMRFTENQESWNVNFYRIDSEYAERSTWSPISRNYSIVNLATNRSMIWDVKTGKPGQNISLIPYVAYNNFRDFEEGVENNTLNFGGDIKYAVTPGLNLDLTINPDFSQVEVDQQQTNLSRFELFFPERRQFFLENADLFSEFGTFGVRPFFSRRIGVAIDTATGQNIQNAIPFGARLSGKVNDNLRIGLLSMQTAQEEDIGVPSYNYTVATIQQKVLARSNFGFIFVNKQTFQSENEYDTLENSSFNRVFGGDFNLASADNKWNGKVYAQYSFDEVRQDSAFAYGGQISYDIPKWQIFSRFESTGAGYNPETGFVRRTDVMRQATFTRWRIFPEGGTIQSHGPGLDYDITFNETYGLLDWDANILYNINFRNTAQFSMRLRREFTYLINPFDPSGSDGLELPENTGYAYNLIIARYESDARKRLFFNLSTRSGEYFNGFRWNLDGEIGYRYQPIGFTSLNVVFNRIVLPEPYNTANLFLIGPRFDFTFTKNLFWTTFIQYNSQIDNMNINSRLQWRFKPVSDFFIVYTDNYFAYTNQNGDFFSLGQSKQRALVFKLSYWFNL